MSNSTSTERNQNYSFLPPINSNSSNRVRKLSGTQNWKIKSINKNNVLDRIEELPKLQFEQPIINKRESIARLNSISFPAVDKRDSIARKPSFFASYLKYRQFRKNTLLSQNVVHSQRDNLKPGEIISRDKAESIINHVLKTQIENAFRKVYYTSTDLDLIKSKLTSITTLIKNEIKANCDKNYRVIVSSTIGELKQQGLIIGSKCFWDKKKDSAINVKFIHNNFFILVNVFMIYRD